MVLNNLYIYLIARINSKKKSPKEDVLLQLSYPTCLHTISRWSGTHRISYLPYIDLPLVFKSDCLLKFLINEG